jgi:hypothetical protein
VSGRRRRASSPWIPAVGAEAAHGERPAAGAAGSRVLEACQSSGPRDQERAAGEPEPWPEPFMPRKAQRSGVGLEGSGGQGAASKKWADLGLPTFPTPVSLRASLADRRQHGLQGSTHRLRLAPAYLLQVLGQLELLQLLAEASCSSTAGRVTRRAQAGAASRVAAQMLKAECPEWACAIRLTKEWAELGLPSYPVDDDGRGGGEDAEDLLRDRLRRPLRRDDFRWAERANCDEVTRRRVPEGGRPR